MQFTDQLPRLDLHVLQHDGTLVAAHRPMHADDTLQPEAW
jgi:hypothetical protein